MENVLVPFRRLVLLTVALCLVAFGLVPAMASAAPLVASPTSVSFGTETVGKTGAPQTVTVSNPDPGSARIAAVTVVGLDAGDFSITGETCGGAILEEGESCTVEVAFAPQAGGAREATLEFAVDAEPAIDVPLEGTGQTMKLTVPGSVSFPATSIGAASTEKVSLKNESEAGITVTEVKFEGPDAADFGIEGNNCNGFIGPGMGCELSVRFSPSGTGPREAFMRVTTDGTPSEAVTELTGEGVTPELIFEPGDYDFGLVEAHSNSPRTNFTLRNNGTASVQLSNLEISGPGAYEFFIPNSSCWGTSLAPGATCGIEVQFNANQEGDFAATLRVGAGNATFEAPLTARAEVPKVTASPAPLTFDATSVGSVQTRVVTLTNTGHLPVAFFIALVSGGDISSFHLVAENCTSNVFAGHPRIFEPGESCAATISFEPQDVGSKAATISFFGGGEGALQVAVAGTAVAPQPAPTPSQPSGESTAASGVSAASSTGPRGRAVLTLKTHGSASASKVTLGRARCESREACVIKVSGLASGRIPTSSGARQGMRPLPASQLKVAPGKSTAITAVLPPEFRHLTSQARLQISLHWRTGSESGAVARTFLLDG